MHPIERLRYVARASWAAPDELGIEAAYALADLASYDAAAILPACRRLLQQQGDIGTLWWVCAHVLAASDPVQRALQCAEEIENDPTSETVDFACASETQRVVRRGSVSEVASARAVLIEARALSRLGFVPDAGASALIAAAKDLAVPLWVRGGVGRVLPDRLWKAMTSCIHRGAIAEWEAQVECVFVGGERLSVEQSVRGLLGMCPEPSELLGQLTR